MLDQQLLKTFLEVADTGSFGVAAKRLYVTQSAVSLRVQRLEGEFGRPLFDRKKAGVTLTPAGREFRGFANAILQNWDEARQRLAQVDAAPVSLVLAAEPSLWAVVGFSWLGLLRAALPDVALRAETTGEASAPDAVQVALTYAPLPPPGHVAEPLIADRLIMVSPWPKARLATIAGRYTLVDWGPAFRQAHDAALPAFAASALVLGCATAGLGYLEASASAGYLPTRLARLALDSGRLWRVEDAPDFDLSAWVHWREDLDPGLLAVARMTLLEAVAQAKTPGAGRSGGPGAAHPPWPEAAKTLITQGRSGVTGRYGKAESVP